MTTPTPQEAAENRRRLLEALRSGKYDKTEGVLRRDDSGSPCFCAGGVALDLIDPCGWDESARGERTPWNDLTADGFNEELWQAAVENDPSIWDAFPPDALLDPADPYDSYLPKEQDADSLDARVPGLGRRTRADHDGDIPERALRWLGIAGLSIRYTCPDGLSTDAIECVNDDLETFEEVADVLERAWAQLEAGGGA